MTTTTTTRVASSRSCGGRGSDDEPAVRKGPWTLEEDLVLVSYISQHGEGSWDNLARAAGKLAFACMLPFISIMI